MKLSMKLGGTYRLSEIDAGAWRMVARKLGLKFENRRDRIRDMAAATPDHLRRIVSSEQVGHRQEHPIVKRLVDTLSARANV
jgi:hypothetical protein